MENQSNSRVTVAVVAAVVALLLGLCAGAAVGGVAGYAIGRQAGARAVAPSALFPAQPGFPFRSTPEGGSGGAAAGTGVEVQDVVANSPADQAGVQPGDIITQVDNVTLDQSHPLAAILAQHKPGDRIRLTVERAGAPHTVTVRLAAYPGNSQRAYLGIHYTTSVPLEATPAP